MSTSQGKVVLVTGAAGDIGHAIAQAFLRRGAMVVASDVRETKLRERMAMLPSADVVALAADLADPPAVTRLADAALSRNGRVDILINNAAIQPDGDLDGCDPGQLEHAFAVNLRAPFLLCRAVAPSMRAAGGGAIVNVTSVHAMAPGPRRLAYATTKTALLGMTRSLAVDLGRDNIRVNALSPGATMTSQLREAWAGRQARNEAADIFEHASRQHPLGRLAEPSEIAEAALFLAESSFISGIELRIDGGLLSSLRLLPE